MDREALLHDWMANLESGCADSTTNEAFVTASFLTPPADQEWAWQLLLDGLRRAASEKAIGLHPGGQTSDADAVRGVTNGRGEAAFSTAPPGRYEAVCSLNGFITVRMGPFDLPANSVL